MMPAGLQMIGCVPMCVSERMHVCQLIIAIYCSINDTFFAFGYGSCPKVNDVLLISSHYKQFKAANPD